MSVIHTFKKRPTVKNLANRSVSFAEVGEVDHVGNEDLVIINIATTTGATTEVKVSGKDFLSGLYERTSKRGVKVKVFKF